MLLNIISGYDHSTLYINNIERGPAGADNTIGDYSNLTEEEGHTWIVGCTTSKRNSSPLPLFKYT